MAQDVRRVRPDAVMRGRDGTLRVFYDKLGVTFQTYRQWLADGAHGAGGRAMAATLNENPPARLVVIITAAPEANDVPRAT